MSLIHEALKKVQESASKPDNEKDIPKHLQPEQEEGEGISRKNIRIIFLIVILIVAIGYMGYQKIFAKKLDQVATQATRVDVSANVGGMKTRQDEVVRLKEAAYKSFGLGNLQDAWVRYTTAGQFNPSDPEIWNNMGVISKKRKELDKAREFYEKSLQLKPDYPEALNNLAALDMEQGNFKQAKENLEKAVAINENYPEANFHLAVILEKLNNVSDAIIYYKKFLGTSKSVSQQFLDEVRTHVSNITVKEMAEESSDEEK